MASLQERNGSYRVQFCYHGKLRGFTIGRVAQDEADTKARQVEYLLMRLKQKLLVLPDGVDIVTFGEHDGRPPAAVPALPATPRQAVTLGHLRDRYLATYGNGTIEASSLYTCRIHLSHVCRLLGDGFPVGDLTTGRLQEYVDRRARAKIAPATIRKELATLRAAWNWGGSMGLTTGGFPNRGLRYPKADEKPPFMTREEIERRIAAGGGPAELGDALYLQTTELSELLDHVRRAGPLPWVYPLACFAAHTRARRSELLRAQVADVDFPGSTVLIREKKRASDRTTRRVPMTPFLSGVLGDWLRVHPGGPHLFCQAGEIARSKTRGPTTGHRGAGRPRSLKGRLAAVRSRAAGAPSAITRNEVHHHFKAALKGDKWECVRGLHTLRHSFVSACASRRIDQRLVQEWCGHMNEVTSRRYRHLGPSTQQEAIKSVFG